MNEFIAQIEFILVVVLNSFRQLSTHHDGPISCCFRQNYLVHARTQVAITNSEFQKHVQTTKQLLKNMAAALPLCEQADQARANGDEAGEWNFLKSGNSDQDVECLWRRSRIFFERAERKQDPEKNLEKGKDECQKALDLDAK
jgi:hypothetical protein